MPVDSLVRQRFSRPLRCTFPYSFWIDDTRLGNGKGIDNLSRSIRLRDHPCLRSRLRINREALWYFVASTSRCKIFARNGPCTRDRLRSRIASVISSTMSGRSRLTRTLR